MIDSQLKKSAKWIEGCSSLMAGVRCSGTDRLKIVLALLDLSCEHQRGIHVLVENRLIGTAFAVLRSQLEACLRGVWFHRCATDKQVAEFWAGEEPPKVRPLLEAVQKLDCYETGFLGSDWKGIWTNLNDLTHGGITQVKARITNNEIYSNYLPEHSINCLQYAASLSLLAGRAIANAANNNQLANDLLSLHESLFEENK